MGNSTAIQQEDTTRSLTPQEVAQLKALVASCSKPNKLLDLSHQQNLYDKCLLLLRGHHTGFQGLDIGHNIIAERVSEVIGKMQLRELVTLQIDNCGLTDHCVELIMRAEPTFLSFLYLNNNKIATAGAKTLSRLSLSHMKTLDLSDNELNDEAVAWLAKGSYIQLSTLLLTHNKITTEGAFALSGAAWFALAFINLSDNEIPTKRKGEVEQLKFRTKLNGFRIQI